ncbi:hypothetical protein PRIC2_008721 [Phytophthora ramorum]
MTMVDDSTAGKYIIQLPNNQTWVVYSSDSSASFSIDSTGSALVSSAAYTGTLRVVILPDSGDQSAYDDYSSCIIRGGNVSVESRTSYSLQWETEGSGCDNTGLLHFALPHQLEAMGDATTTQSSGAIVLHSATRGQMVGQVTTSGSWTLTEDEADDEVDFYPANKPSADVVSQIGLLATLQSDIDTTMDDGLTRSWALYNAASRGGSSSSGSTSTVTVTPSTTAAPVATTSTPTSTTATPVATTAAPTSTTATPVATTAAPTSTTAAPVATTSTPTSTTAAPVATAAAPTSATATPVATTATPVAPTATPVATTCNPKTGVTTAPAVTTATSNSWKNGVGQF